MFSFKTDGSPKNCPLIFFHGFLGNKYDWKHVISHLIDQFFCISVDLPGHGKSAITNKTSFDEFGLIFTQFTKAEKLEKSALIGYSMGGRIAHYIHSNYLKNQLCICIGSHFGLTSKAEIEKRKAWNKTILAKLENSSIDEFLEFWYSQKIFNLFRNSDLYSSTLRYRKNNNKKFLKKAFLAFCIMKQKVLFPDLKTYFIAGQNDAKYLQYYQKVKCPYQIVKDASHVIHLENSKGLAEKIKEILHGNC